MQEFYNGEIESIICNAINIIVQKQIENANYDKLISATVISDNLKGEYKYSGTRYSTTKRNTYQDDCYYVEYQNSKFIAYPLDENKTYQMGDRVLILVPNNDMTNEKYILRRRPQEV